MHSVGCSSGTQLTKRRSSSWQRAILLKPKYNHTFWRPWQCIFGYVKCVEIRGSVHTGEIWKRRFHFESSSNVFTHTTLEIFKNGVFTLKTHQMFLPILHSVERFENAPITGSFLDLCLRKTRAGESRDYRDVIVFEKLRFQINKLTSVFYASVLLLIINFVITLSK